MAVDRLGGSRTLVSGEQGDAFHGNAVGGQDQYEGVPHLPGHPVLAEACLLGDDAERADHVVRGQRRADPGGEDQAVLLPQLASRQPIPLLLLHVLAERFHAPVRQRQGPPGFLSLGIATMPF